MFRYNNNVDGSQLASTNGLCSTGFCYCTVATTTTTTITKTTLTSCQKPASSVLFDGMILTLTGLDGDNWARHHFTMNATTIVPSSIYIANARVDRVEITIHSS